VLRHWFCCCSCCQAVPNATNKLSEADIDALSKRTQDGGTEVVQAKAGKVRAWCRPRPGNCCRWAVWTRAGGWHMRLL